MAVKNLSGRVCIAKLVTSVYTKRKKEEHKERQEKHINVGNVFTHKLQV